MWDARLLRLGSDAGVDELGVHALRLETGLADLAGVVGDDEGADDEVAGLERLHFVADRFHDADVLVTHQRVVDGLDAAVGPEVGPADAGRGQADDGVGRLDDLRRIAILDAHVARPVEGESLHRRHGRDPRGFDPVSTPARGIISVAWPRRCSSSRV